MALPTTSTGKVVSFDESGALQVGAGTSLYKSLLSNTIGANSCPGYPSLAALASGFYLLSYSNRADQSSTLQLIYTSAPNKAQILTSVSQAYFIFSTVALDIGQGTFLSICQDYSSSSDQALLIPGTVNYQTNAITLNTAKAVQYLTAQYSVYPSLIRLSNSAFAIAYASTSPFKMTTRAGSLDASQTISLSDAVYFADNTYNSTIQAMTPLTESSYLLAFYDQNQVPDERAGSLKIVLADVATNLAVSLSDAMTNNESLLSYYLDATTLSNDTVVVVYSNANDNNNLVAQEIKVLNENIYPSTSGNYSVTFGAQWVVQTGRVFYANDAGYPDVDIERIDDAGNFLIAFSDLSNDLALTISQGWLTSSGEIVRASPDFVLYTPPSTSLQTAAVYTALATGQDEAMDSQTAIFYFGVDSDQCSAAPLTSSFNLYHRLPGPAGITTSSSSSSSSSYSSSSGTATSVAVSGVLSDVYSTLMAGRVYYANTLGSIVDGGVYLGRSQADEEEYVYDSANNALVTTASKVGFSMQANQLLVQLAN